MHPRRHEGSPRRPRRRDGHETREGGYARGDSSFDRERSEQEFTEEMHGRLQQFLASDEQGMALEPMNSFKRRVVHNLAKEYGIETESRGEDRDRHVYLIRTTSSATPSNAPRRKVGPTEEQGLPGDDEDAGPDAESPPLSAEPPPQTFEERTRPPEERPRAREERPRRAEGRARAPEDATDLAGSSRVWDFGSQTFPVNPGAQGVHIAVKRDGSIEIFQERDRNHIVADRVVTSKQFRVRKNRIIQPGEPDW
jgi:hypothetical protein